VVDGLVPGSTYTFTVKCTNLVGDSLYSDSYAFLVVAPPSPPINLSVDSANENSVVLSWGASLTNGGQSISSYMVYRTSLEDSIASPTLLSTVSSSTFGYTDSAVTSGSSYSYFVTSANVLGGESDPSAQVSTQTIAPPQGMSQPLLVSKTSTSITVAWTAPTSDGSADVEYDSLVMKPEYSSRYSEVYRGLSKFFTVNDLDAGFSYLFKVQAVNAAGASSFSQPSASIFAAVEPDPPVQLTLVSRSSSQIKISWRSPANSGGMAISGYKVYVAVDSGLFAEDTAAPSRTDPTKRTYEITSVTSGSLYSFKVSAVNEMGEGMASNPIQVRAADLPNKPANPPTILSHGTTSVTLSFTAIPGGSDGGSAITGYILMMDNGLGSDASYEVKSNSLLTSVTISNLIPGRTYRVKYTGRNIVYDSNNLFGGDKLLFSDPAYFTTAVNPDPPQNLRQAPLAYRTSVVIEWDAPSSTGSSPISEYILMVTDVAASTQTVQSISPSVDSFLVSGLTPGKEYEFNMKSVNAFGQSDYSASPLTAYPGVVPTSPAPVVFSSVSRTSITISWTLLTNEDTGGTSAEPIPITSYNLYSKNAAGSSGYFLLASLTGSTYVVTHLPPGVLYDFRISAVNVIGESAISTSSQMMAGAAPSSPGKPSVVVRYPTVVRISWSEPFDNGGTRITSYSLTITDTSTSTAQQMTVIGATSFEFTPSTGIVAGVQYSVKIRANNYVTESFASKVGADSALTTFSTSVAPAAAPSLVASSVTRTSAVVSWSLLANTNQTGFSTTAPVYYLESDDGRGGNFFVLSSSTSATSQTLTGVTPGTTLRFRMRVQNVAGFSPYSEILQVQFAEVPSAPSAPALVDRSADTTDGKSPYISISWSDPSDSGGIPILGAKVEIKENLGSWSTAYEGESSSSISSWRFEGLNAGSQYTFRVYVRNNVGWSSAGSESVIY